MKEQNGSAVFHSAVILVGDVEKSKRFYSLFSVKKLHLILKEMWFLKGDWRSGIEIMLWI
jgi:hypothetical protein